MYTPSLINIQFRRILYKYIKQSFYSVKFSFEHFNPYQWNQITAVAMNVYCCNENLLSQAESVIDLFCWNVT